MRAEPRQDLGSAFHFVAKAEIEVPIPANVVTMNLGYGDTRRIRFVVEYDAAHPEEADGFLRDTIAEVGAVLLDAPPQLSSPTTNLLYQRVHPLLRYSMTSENSVALGKALPKAYFALARLAYPADLIAPQPPLARDPEWRAQEC